jgi:probable DNA metabolism protein
MSHTVRLRSVNDFAEWRAAARALLLAGIPPEQVTWADPAVPMDLFSPPDSGPEAVTGRKAGVVPPRFLRIAEAALCHHDPLRFAFLYSLLWRLQKDRAILFNLEDNDVSRINRRVEAVAAEVMRMKKELRFRRSVSADGHKGFAAWFEPRHYVLERVAPYFAREIGHEDWVIATPYRTAYWDGKELSFADPRPSQASRRA